VALKHNQDTKMRILKIRTGFATNSSSTHSIVYLPDATSKPSQDLYSFGWEFFTLVTRPEKIRYLVAQLALNIREKDALYKIVKELFPHEYNEIIKEIKTNEVFVDHQSVLYFPRNQNRRGLNVAFLKDFRDFLMREGIVVAGGNDNESESFRARARSMLLRCFDTPMIARKDKSVWILFDRKSGNKVRIQFCKTGIEDAKYEKASVPELVDVKITNHCNRKCPYCYEDSRPDGKHASLKYIKQLAKLFGKAGVFEVALGGGEPTAHPEFAEILKIFHENNVVPNFSTRNLSWFDDDEKVGAVRAYTGGFGFSADRSHEIELLDTLIVHKFGEDFKGRVKIHITLGAMNEADFNETVRAAEEHNFRVLFLGYKPTGRGASFSPIPYNYDWIKKTGLCSFGIDTVLAKQFKDDLEKEKIDPRYYETEEGKFSCAIDAIEKTIAPASHMPDKKIKLKNPREWLEIFSKF